MTPDDGIAAVRAALDAAEEVHPPAPPPEDGGGAGDSAGGGPADLWPDCPVLPLGMSGGVYHYLDALGQYRAIEAGDHSRQRLYGLFGPQAPVLLREFAPRWAKHQDPRDPNQVAESWRPELIAERLMAACARRGIWDPTDRVRGAGAWRVPDGALVWHCGDVVLVSDPARPGHLEERPPGLYGRHIYPTGTPRPRPARDRQKSYAQGGPAAELMAMLSTWNWRRGADQMNLDAMLLMGGIAAGMLGAALKWRPLLWLSGDRGTGKSTLHELMEGVHDGGLVHATDASAAGIWQALHFDCLPVALDEIEAEADGRKAENVLKLARAAASGGLVLRGGAEHKGTSFTARSAFVFSSILIPPLQPQDRSRIAVLELGQLGGTTPPVLDQARLAAIGAGLRRRLVDGWHRWPETLERWRQGLAAVGHRGRGADQYGTLLAAADLLMYDVEPDSDSVEMLCALLRAGELAEREDDLSDAARCLLHLTTSIADLYRSGGQRTIGAWIEEAVEKRREVRWAENAPEGEAGGVLAAYGLKVVNFPAGEYLAVANQHQGLGRIFANTHWAGRSGTSGVWAQSLRRLDGAQAHGPLRFNGQAQRCTVIPLARVLSPPGEDPPSTGDAP